MTYPVKFSLSYDEFVKTVKNIHTCCAFVDSTYKQITDSMREKIKAGELLITEYHDQPLGEVIYLEAASILQ